MAELPLLRAGCCNLQHQPPNIPPSAPSTLPNRSPPLPLCPQAIADSAGGGADADAILLSPDFDDFDPSLVGGFDGGFAAGGGGEGGEDEAF